MKHDYDGPSGLSHENPSSKTAEARTTFLSDVNKTSLSHLELNTFLVHRLLHLNAPETLIVDTGRNVMGHLDTNIFIFLFFSFSDY